MPYRLSALGLIASLIAAPAFAGGPAVTADDPAPAVAPASQQDWSGFHLGLFGTGISGDNVWEDNTPTSSSPGEFSDTLPGLSLGYDFQMGRLVLGLGASITTGEFVAQGTNGPLFNCGGGCKTTVDGLKTVYARVGFAAGRTLIYTVAGASSADVNAYSNGFFTDVTDTLSGTTYGIGVEHALNDRISVSGEMLRTDLGTLDIGSSCGSECQTDVAFDQFQIGLNIRF